MLDNALFALTPRPQIRSRFTRASDRSLIRPTGVARHQSVKAYKDEPDKVPSGVGKRNQSRVAHLDALYGCALAVPDTEASGADSGDSDGGGAVTIRTLDDVD